jgi:hypothetical protein
MFQQPQNQIPQNPDLVIKVIWMSITVSILVLVFVVHLISESWDVVEWGSFVVYDTTLFLTLSLFACFAGIASLSIHKIIKYDIKKAHLPHYKPEAFVFQIFIMRLALSEAMTIIGFVLSLINENKFVIIPFAMTSLLLNFYHFPNLNKLKKQLIPMKP